MAMQSSSSSSSISYVFKYQVFLSFRGSDTRYGFTGNLYKALTDKGIHTFIDDSELQRGDEITPSLDNAIEESRIFIPVFSANYASSSFCLDELVHIIHLYKQNGRLVLPVFFGVDPSHVRHHRGSYGEALAKHEERFQHNTDHMERLQKWKIALTQAANLSGDHRSPGYEYKLTGKIAFNQTPDLSSDCSQRYEYDFIGDIVKYISNKINRVPLHVANYPVGFKFRIQQVKLLLDKETNKGVHMVGLYGIGGLGKSTLARAIYNFIGDQFDGLCFLHDVRENSAKNNLKHLQEKLLLKTIGLEIKLDHVSEGIPIIKERLCRKKILLILDDVDNMNQLHALAGGLDWFGRGSRVIITTRDKHLLSSHGIKSTHAVEGLNGTEALELLRWMAFKSDKVPSGYEDILNRAVAYSSGLPLVIEVVGSNLFGKSIEKWKSTLDGYDKIPNKEIQKILKVSYDALEEEEQSVFLDIACCFKGCGWADVKDILHAHYGHCITHHLEVLAEKSLIDRWEYDGCVGLHDLIEDMGKEVVRQESPKEPGERSRLWCQDDIVHALNENTSLEEIRGIPPNLEELSAYKCESLSSSSRRMLTSQKLHEAGGTEFYFPNGTDGIPNWFEHQIRGQSTITFWFRKKIPSITYILLSPEHWLGYPKVNIFVNGYEIEIDITLKFGISDHTLLFDLKLEEHNKRLRRIYGIKYESEMDKALLENEWIRVELELKSFNLSEEEKNEMLRSAQMGIHVLKEKNNAEEENVIFTDPYRETKSQKKRKQNMFSILMEYNEL
ncbi:disease resistance protein RPV1 isoform X2 [Medicago truncatula]|uniref:disease resistance protein RPV1 isoform X2 n=1 Tax=Medicago truncatula TaxID=3880 RepID=UPI0019687B43|nr:disease resistance protein RPV1 isoform X2 [Medicago truncatula]